jgi:hypothetical protein
MKPESESFASALAALKAANAAVDAANSAVAIATEAVVAATNATAAKTAAIEARLDERETRQCNRPRPSVWMAPVVSPSFCPGQYSAPASVILPKSRRIALN